MWFDLHSPGKPTPKVEVPGWFVIGIFLGAIILGSIVILRPFTTKAEDPSLTRLVFVGSTVKPFDWVRTCVGQNWDGQLNLRSRKPPQMGKPVSRFDNPVRHFNVDVIDEGSERVVKGYSRKGEPFSPQVRTALQDCLD